jgi:ketosteroid isomerase-like protein
MSQENVEVLRRAYEAWNAGDMTTLRELYHPHVVMHHPEGWPEPGPSIGREAVFRQMAQLREAWEGDTLEPVTDFITASDHVVVRDIWRATGRGPDTNMEFTRVFTFREGKIVSIRDHAEAIEAVGLSEQDAHADS